MANFKDVIVKVMTDCKKPEDLSKVAMWDPEKKKAKPVASYKIIFDSQQNQLEPIYYWLLDFISDMGWTTEKVTDNFAASPGSAQFSEIGQRASVMQDRFDKMSAGLNQIIKSCLNIIYDLKEFELRLKHYEDANNSDDPKKKEGANLALKQIWLDNVDMKRGRGAIHQMAAELGYTTIREAFMMANSFEDLDKMVDDNGGGIINDQVKRILQPRIKEFFDWKEYSYDELKKRRNIEKNYLQSQIQTIKLYSSWMKPYLQAAQELQQKGFDKNSALVHAFSTTMFELTLLATKEEKAPGNFKDYNMRRKYFSCIVLNMTFRGHVSQRVTQKGDYGFAMGGRIDMTFDSYAMNEEELKVVKNEQTKEEITDMTFSLNMAEDALKELKQDLDHFLKTEDEKKKEETEENDKKKKEAKSQDVNPFSALFSIFNIFGKKEEKKEGDKKEINSCKDIVPDNYIEKTVRTNAANTSAKTLYTVYDIYKKAHGMASAPGEGFKNLGPSETKSPKLDWKDAMKGSFAKVK